MFTHRKVIASPSLPKFKQQINVTDSTDEDSTNEDSADEGCKDVKKNCNTLPNFTNEYCKDFKTLRSSSMYTTDEDYEDVGTLRNASMFTTDDDYEDVGMLRNASMFTTDDDYEDVGTFRNTKFFNFDTDQLVVASTQFLLDDNLGENLKYINPVAFSTQRFSETSRFVETNHHKPFKHVKEPTFVLPKPPHFNEENDDALDIQLGLPKACSTFLQPQGIGISFLNDDTCDIHLSIPKACSTPLPAKEKEPVLSSFDSVTPLPERTFASEIQDPFAKRINSDIADATESTAKSHKISPNNYFGHKNSASTSYLHGNNFDMSELSSLMTNSFPKTCIKQELETRKRIVKAQHVINPKSPIRDDRRCMKKKQHVLPNNDLDQNHAICCLSNTVQTFHSLKVMKPYYRTDVPIDDLCK